MTTYEIWEQNQKTGKVEVLDKTTDRKLALYVFDNAIASQDCKIKVIVKPERGMMYALYTK